jgi:hypothetical protein
MKEKRDTIQKVVKPTSNPSCTYYQSLFPSSNTTLLCFLDWFDLVWFGLVWFGLVWFDLI